MRKQGKDQHKRRRYIPSMYAAITEKKNKFETNRVPVLWQMLFPQMRSIQREKQHHIPANIDNRTIIPTPLKCRYAANSIMKNRRTSRKRHDADNAHPKPGPAQGAAVPHVIRFPCVIPALASCYNTVPVSSPPVMRSLRRGSRATSKLVPCIRNPDAVA